ncbi:efflux RND transporter periplasmic adaptor subunit [Anaerovorax odorimutans]|uniref:efflux RND transporter periplasmic adaptor subunit n=1 Tax=Anaerovorax odorimutans TaxID=109327 RepID=UPI0003FDDFAB|nr:efflux RND transporter periplasmic adaptor subunit [Anaerovorax odorimutans]
MLEKNIEHEEEKKEEIKTKEIEAEEINTYSDKPKKKFLKKKNKEDKMPKIKKSKKKKVIIVIIVLLIIGFAAYKVLMPHEVQGINVTTGSAEKMDVEQVVSIKGIIEGAETANISTSLNYEVESILVSEGDKVSKEQVLAVLDSESVEADYNKARKNLEQSKFKYDASQTLYSQGAISEEDLISARTTYENDKITVDSFDELAQTQIKSPINGTVTRVNTSKGRAANDTPNDEPMFVIEDLDHLQMKVKISEYDINKIKLNQPVTISAEVLGPNNVSGVVSKISPTGETKESGSKEMVIPVTIDVNKGNQDLFAGVSAKADISIEKKTDVLTVPIDAILTDPNTGKNSVMVVKNNKLKKVLVELGTEGDFNVEVTSGELKEGNKVVLGPTLDMTDGMEVTSMPQE